MNIENYFIEEGEERIWPRSQPNYVGILNQTGYVTLGRLQKCLCLSFLICKLNWGTQSQNGRSASGTVRLLWSMFISFL